MPEHHDRGRAPRGGRTDETSPGTASSGRSDPRHELHGALFAIDVAVDNMTRAHDRDEREQLGRAVRQELERVHALVRLLSDPPGRV